MQQHGEQLTNSIAERRRGVISPGSLALQLTDADYEEEWSETETY